MNIDKRFYSYLILVSLIIYGTAQAGDERDIYDRTTAIAESLQTWSVNPPVLETEGENLSLSDMFMNAEVLYDDSSNVIRIILPTYMGMLTTELIGNTTLEGRTSWTVPLLIEADFLIIDEKWIPCPAEILEDSLAVDYIKDRLTSLRTLGLPFDLQNTPKYLADSVTVKLRGRDTRQFRFTSEGWQSSLSYMANGMQVYAGLISVDTDTSGFGLKYYILLTLPEAKGHHFLTVTDRLERSDDNLKITETIVKFLPYVRTDNLKNLFDTAPKREDEPEWEIKINE